MGIAKQGGPWRIQFSLKEDSTFFLLPVSNLTKMVWGRSAPRSRGINAVGRQSEGSVLRVAEDRTLMGVLQLVVVALCVLVQEDLRLITCLSPISPEKACSEFVSVAPISEILCFAQVR